MNQYAMRQVNPHEAAIVARHRLRMFQDMGEVPAELADPLLRSSKRALAALLASGDYIGWFAVDASGDLRTLYATVRRYPNTESPKRWTRHH